MLCTTAEAEGEVGRLASSKSILLSFQDDTSVVVIIVLCFGVEFLFCLHLLYVFMFG